MNLSSLRLLAVTWRLHDREFNFIQTKEDLMINVQQQTTTTPLLSMRFIYLLLQTPDPWSR